MIHPTALITGAAVRLGKSIAQAFFENDCNLMLHYNQSEVAAQKLCDTFNHQRKNSCHLIQADLSKKSEREKVITACINQYGRLDHLVNNAATFYPTPLFESDESQLNQFMQINFLAPLHLIQQVVPYLKKQKGSVTNIIDIYAEAGLEEHFAYVAAKAALQQVTQQLAAELAPEIRVNGVSPGAILWPENLAEGLSDDQIIKQNVILENTALKSLGEPENIAATVSYLALKASYTTGSIIKVDGGRRWYI